ncbi:hypothetical protein [Miltoncostaea marina]|uniref:hypothetical protein n=1 Tax=Miltoncostaea marina TaxID=2843215 RepID=UPI001C3CFC54|nr:hypothetical protein [Miltoncostaea marina]
MTADWDRAGPSGRRAGGREARAPAWDGAGDAAAARLRALGGAAGNRAVAARLARAPAEAPPVAGPPAPAPPSPVTGAGAVRVVGPPAPTRVEGAERLTDVDVGSGAREVTVTFLVGRDVHLKGREGSAIDWLHEPGVTVTATPGRVPRQVIEAAVAAMNLHLRAHGTDLVEVAVSPQVAVDHEGRPSAGAQLQVEVAVTSTFSLTAATGISAGPRGGGPEDDSVPLAPERSAVDLTWSPMSIAAVFALPEPGGPRGAPEGPGHDYARDMEDGRAGAWVAAQLRPDELGPIDATTLVDDLIGAMRAAHGAEAALVMRLGAMPVAEIPPGVVRALARAASLVVRAKPSLGRLSAVRVDMRHIPPGSDRETSLRWFTIPVAGEAVVTAPAAPAPAAPRTWGAP